MARARVHWLGRNRETSSSSCSWGANWLGQNGMRRRVHREATKRVGANRLGRNGMRGRVHREGLDGTSDGNEAWRTVERRKRPCVRPDTFETGSCSSGGVWRTAKWRKRTSYGRNGGPVDREGCGVPQNRRNRLVLERYDRNGGPVDREGCGIPQNGRNGPPTIKTGSC